jgi:hypothetical protein
MARDVQLFLNMTDRGRSIVTAALSSLIASIRPKAITLRLVIHGTIAKAPPALGSRVKVCVTVLPASIFIGGEGKEQTYCADTTTDEAGQFTAGVMIPTNWRGITSSEVCLAQTSWTGNVPPVVNPHDDEATGGQTADVTVVYQ